MNILKVEASFHVTVTYVSSLPGMSCCYANHPVRLLPYTSKSDMLYIAVCQKLVCHVAVVKRRCYFVVELLFGALTPHRAGHFSSRHLIFDFIESAAKKCAHRFVTRVLERQNF